jgi:hypothetical protein
LTANDPFTFVDLDDCCDPTTHIIAPWAHEIIERFDTFAEGSQSGNGLHLIVRGTPAWHGKEGGKKPWHDGAVEVYSGRRFVAMTLAALPNRYYVSEVDRSVALDALCREVGIDLGSKSAVAATGVGLPPPRNQDLTDDDVRARIYAGPDARAFHRFMTLRNADELLALKIYKSLSDADWDLARVFIRQVGGDVDRVETLMRATPLEREKWNRHKTYLREQTIEKAAIKFALAPPPEATGGLQGYSDLAVLDLPDPEYLIDGVLLNSSWNLVAGRWGAGKTFLQLDWLLHVASGRAWQGQKVKQGPTLLVYAEGAIKPRIAAWRAAQRVEPTGALGLTVAPGTVNLLDADAVGAFLRQVEAGDLGGIPVLVVIETLARSIPGGDENKSETMSQVTASVDTIRRELGAVVSVTHHSPWEAKRLRGFSGLGDNADSVYFLENANPDAARDESMRLTLTCQKLREGEWPAPTQLKLTPFSGSRVIEADPEPRAAPAALVSSSKVRDRREALLMAMADGTWTLEELCHKTGRSRGSVQDDLKVLVAGGDIEPPQGSGKRGDPFRYTSAVPPI